MFRQPRGDCRTWTHLSLASFHPVPSRPCMSCGRECTPAVSLSTAPPGFNARGSDRVSLGWSRLRSVASAAVSRSSTSRGAEHSSEPFTGGVNIEGSAATAAAGTAAAANTNADSDTTRCITSAVRGCHIPYSSGRGPGITGRQSLGMDRERRGGGTSGRNTRPWGFARGRQWTCNAPVSGPLLDRAFTVPAAGQQVLVCG